MTEQFELAANKMRGWYGNGIPSKLGSRFYEFAVRTHELANLVVGKETKLKVSNEVPAACCDGETIYLPSGYFSEKYYDFLGVPPDLHAACAVACINGSQIHEAFHLHETVCKLDEMIKPYVDNHEVWLKKPGFATCLQLSEDLYIEEWGRAKKPFLSDPFIEAKNDVLFSFEKFVEIREKLKTPETSDQRTLLQLLTYLKNTRYQWNEAFDPWLDIVNVFEEARDVTVSKEGRVRIAIRAWELLKEEKAENGESLGEPEGGFGEENLDASSYISGNIKESEKFVDKNGVEAKTYKEFFASLSDVEQYEVEKIAKKVNEELEIIERERSKVDSHKKWPELKIIPVDTLVRNRLESDPNFNKFGNFLRRAKEVKHVPGEPKTSGTNILTHRLAHIASDGKVLAFPDLNKLKRGKPEVIFLMDFSGSMSGLAYSVARATQGAHLSLVQAGVPVATYAHTSVHGYGSEYRETPAIFPIAAFDLPFGSKQPIRHSVEATKIRFGQATEINKRENFDGVAIEYCSKQFTSRQGTKILIVLSDGAPQGGLAYSGEFAENHTKEVIRLCRKKGIIVFSLSLTTGVMSDNNTIYGKDYNFPAWGENLDQSLKSLSYQISVGGKSK